MTIRRRVGAGLALPEEGAVPPWRDAPTFGASPRARVFSGGTVPRPAGLPVQNDRRDACPTQAQNTSP